MSGSVPLVAAFSVLAGCGGVGLDPLASGPEAGPEGVGDDLTPVAESLADRTYLLDLADAAVVEPSGLGSLLEGLDSDYLLFHVLDETDDALSMAVTQPDGDGEQQPCVPVFPLPAADWTSNPAFYLDDFRLDVSLGGERVSLQKASLSAVVSETGRHWNEGVLLATLDTRDLAALLPPATDGCTYVGSMGGECGPCVDGADLCTAVELDGILADESARSFDPEPDLSGCE